MDTLVICIDRDDDLGEKAKVITPVIGRGANIAAAVSLATADPEDSDTNTIFGGIRILDELRSMGVDAEIVSFAGDRNVGTISDKKIADQLDEFLSTQDVKSAIFVSDGAEDESLIPLVQSRIKVDSVQRIIVMQSERLESTYYMIKNFLKDPKMLQTFFVPIGLALIIYALAMATSNPQWAIIGTFFAVGIYMILRAYSFNDKVVLGWKELKKSYRSHQLSFITTIASILFFIIGTINGLINVWEIMPLYDGLIELLSMFIKSVVLWYACSVFIYLIGKIFDQILLKQDYQNQIVVMLFALSGTLLFWSSSSYVLSLSTAGSYLFPVEYFIYSVTLGIIIALVGIYFSFDGKNEIKPNNEMKNKTPQESGDKKEKPILTLPKTTEKRIFISDSGDFKTDRDDKKDEKAEPVKIKIGIRGGKD
ncbi:MAG: DUF373 family protein [Methanimicrococcus sp.]|nr:DUF373 family protein [Methanimicrococcus sp.]MDY0266744.1 DUF373 family protein [Methanimicrococcus sp.]